MNHLQKMITSQKNEYSVIIKNHNNKMATFKAVILTGKKDIKEDGTTNIKIRITHLRKINYISTELYINPVQMDNKTGQVKGKN